VEENIVTTLQQYKGITVQLNKGKTAKNQFGAEKKRGNEKKPGAQLQCGATSSLRRKSRARWNGRLYPGLENCRIEK